MPITQPTPVRAARCHAAGVGPLSTVPNAVTLVRTVAAIGLAMWAVSRGDPRLLGGAYAVYWLGDMVDGWSARRLHQETRLGAVFDIVSDRACTALLCTGLVIHLPVAWLVAAVFLISFLVVDTMLSLSFLCWPVMSPNYFHVVDRRVWMLNWSPVAKASNTAGVVVFVALGWYAVALFLAVAILMLKLWSVRRVWSLLTGEDQ